MEVQFDPTSIQMQLIMFLIIVGAAWVSRLHKKRIRKSYSRFLNEKEVKTDTDAIKSLHDLAEIQEEGLLEYFYLILLSLVVLAFFR